MKNKKMDRRVKKTRALIKDALVQLLAEKEFSSISITEIVHLSDLNRSTFYAHFQDKEDLLACLIDELVNGLIQSIAGSPPILEESLKQKCSSSNQAAVQLFTYVADHAAYFKVLLKDQKVPQFTQQLSGDLHAFYVKELDRHPGQCLINKGFLACSLTSIMIGFIYHWLIHTDMKYTPEYMADELAKVCSLNPQLRVLTATESTS